MVFYARPRLRRWSIHLVVHVARFVDVFWFATPRTPPLWQRDFFFGKLFVVATLVGFGEKRCRNNLRLGDRDVSSFRQILDRIRRRYGIHACSLFPVSYTHLTLPTICSV